MDEKEKAPEVEFEIIETPAGAQAEGAEPPPPAEEDERLRSDEDDDEEDHSGNEQETPEQRAERRREERRKRKERQRRAEAEAKAEIQRLREANEFLGSKMQQFEALALRNEARAVDQRLFEARKRHEYAEQAHAEAVARGDGIGASNALRAINAAAADYNEAQAIRGRLMSIGQEPMPQPRPQGPDPTLVSKARAFIEKHAWIDPSGTKDEDSAVARALDIKLQADGYDPRTDEYWETLERKLKERLPHRFKSGRQSPPVTGGMDRAASGKRPFYLSPERKKAIIDAGMWDDPTQRQKMIKRYAEYDAQQKTKATR